MLSNTRKVLTVQNSNKQQDNKNKSADTPKPSGGHSNELAREGDAPLAGAKGRESSGGREELNVYKTVYDPSYMNSLKTKNFVRRFNGKCGEQYKQLDYYGEPKDPRRQFGRIQQSEDIKVPHFIMDDEYVGIPPTREVTISNLNDNISEKFLRDMAKNQKLPLEDVVVFRHPRNGKHLTMALLLFKNSKTARQFAEENDGISFMGKRVSCKLDPFAAKLSEMYTEMVGERLPTLKHLSGMSEHELARRREKATGRAAVLPPAAAVAASKAAVEREKSVYLMDTPTSPLVEAATSPPTIGSASRKESGESERRARSEKRRRPSSSSSSSSYFSAEEGDYPRHRAEGTLKKTKKTINKVYRKFKRYVSPELGLVPMEISKGGTEQRIGQRDRASGSHSKQDEQKSQPSTVVPVRSIPLPPPLAQIPLSSSQIPLPPMLVRPLPLPGGFIPPPEFFGLRSTPAMLSAAMAAAADQPPYPMPPLHPQMGPTGGHGTPLNKSAIRTKSIKTSEKEKKKPAAAAAAAASCALSAAVGISSSSMTTSGRLSSSDCLYPVPATPPNSEDGSSTSAASAADAAAAEQRANLDDCISHFFGLKKEKKEEEEAREIKLPAAAPMMAKEDDRSRAARVILPSGPPAVASSPSLSVPPPIQNAESGKENLAHDEYNKRKETEGRRGMKKGEAREESIVHSSVRATPSKRGSSSGRRPPVTPAEGEAVSYDVVALKKKNIDSSQSERSNEGGRRSGVEKKATENESRGSSSSGGRASRNRARAAFSTHSSPLPKEEKEEENEGMKKEEGKEESKEEKQRASGRGKRKADEAEVGGGPAAVAAAASSPSHPPPTKKLAVGEVEKEKETGSIVPSSTPKDEEEEKEIIIPSTPPSVSSNPKEARAVSPFAPMEQLMERYEKIKKQKAIALLKANEK